MAAYDPIQARFNEVIRDFQTKLNNDELYNEIRNFTSAEDVYEATDKLQAEQARNGHLRHLSKIGPFLERMQDYSEAIKIFVQVKPDVLGLIWGPIRLLLQWTSILKQSFDAIINTTAEIGDLLPEFLEVTKLFDQNTQLKDVLVLFFQDILDFYLVALQFFSKSRWRYVFEALWPRERNRLKLITAQIGRHSLLIRSEVRLEHIREEHQARLEALAHFEKSEKANIRQEHEILRNSVSPRSYSDKLNWYHGRVCAGTSRWLMDDPNFTKWLDHDDDTMRLLWLRGIPGSGKTFLAGAIIDQARLSGRTMFAFLSYAYAKNTTALSILHSLIFQLTYDDIDLQAILCQTSKENFTSSANVAASVLSTLLSSLETTYIVIDGLDEIDRIERGRLLSHMIVISKNCANVRITISSRADSDILEKIGSHFTGIQVNDHNTGSVHAFVTQKTHDFLESRNFVEDERIEIEGLLAPIAIKAEGMFLYAKVLLDCIELLPDVDSIRAELRVLPQDLHDAYSRILSRVNGLRSAMARQNARQILGWIGSSPTPLTIREIEQALTVKPYYEAIATPVKASLNLVELCGPIVEADDEYVRFVHFTVKEYIFDKDIDGYIDLSGTMLDLTNRCIYYFCKEQFDKWLTREEIKEHLLQGSYRLHHYAMTNWLELVTLCINRQRSEAPSPHLISALETMISMRSHYDFSDFPLSPNQVKKPELDLLEQHDPNISQMLRHVVRFNQQLTGSAVHLDNIDDWKWSAPLTMIHTSREIHRTIDSTLCHGMQHIANCPCAIVKRHHGSHTFKCGYLDCPSFRYGFPHWTAQRQHEKLHSKPWKCNEPGCEYAEVGFLSQNMRDAHANMHREARKPQVDLTTGNDGQNATNALLIDLIQLDRVSEIEALLDHIKKRKYHVMREVLEVAVDHGSTTVIKMVSKSTRVYEHDEGYMAAYSIGRGNLEAFQIVKLNLGKIAHRGYRILLRTYLNSTSFEMHKECEDIIFGQSFDKLADPGKTYETVLMSNYFNYEVPSWTHGQRERELKLISVWERASTMQAFQTERKIYLGRTLFGAVNSGSILLAKALLRHGVSIDYRRSDHYLTPLHFAVRQDSEDNAKMVEFLLYNGADPEAHAGCAVRKISEGKGAKGIAKWLNMSWEELVEKVKADRARGYCPPEYQLDSDEDAQ